MWLWNWAFPMPRSVLIPIIASLLLISPVLAASRVPGGGGLPALPDAQASMQRRMMTAPKAVSPYPMNYSEHVARSLGIRDGGVALFDARTARDPMAPSVGLGGTMIRLRWRQ